MVFCRTFFWHPPLCRDKLKFWMFSIVSPLSSTWVHGFSPLPGWEAASPHHPANNFSKNNIDQLDLALSWFERVDYLSVCKFGNCVSFSPFSLPLTSGLVKVEARQSEQLLKITTPERTLAQLEMFAQSTPVLLEHLHRNMNDTHPQDSSVLQCSNTPKHLQGYFPHLFYNISGSIIMKMYLKAAL